MTIPNFVSAHCHPGSFDSGSSPEQFAKREVELGTGAMVVTDHGTLEMTRRVYNLCKDNKKYQSLTPILGCEGYFRDDNCDILSAAGAARSKDGTFRDHLKYQHLTLHCLDEEAYSALSRVLSDADLRAEQHGSERKPLFSWKDLEYLGSYNITCGSGCLIGMVSRHLLDHNDPRTALKYYDRMRSCFKPGNFYAEVFPHNCTQNWESCVRIEEEGKEPFEVPVWKTLKTQAGSIKAKELAQEFQAGAKLAAKKHIRLLEVMENRAFKALETPIEIKNVVLREGFVPNECRPWCPNGDVQAGVNRFVIGVAESRGDKILISDDSHFAYPHEKVVQDIRLKTWRMANNHYRFSSEEALAYFKNDMGIGEDKFRQWVDNTLEWSQRFKNFKFAPRKALPTAFYPENSFQHTMKLIAAHGRMDWSDPWRVERLKAEINLLHKNGTVDLLPYFFVIEEVCRLYAKNGRLTGPGRGSAAGLQLSWLLGITHADPKEFKLSMERFMTLDRIQNNKLPDIDQDLPSRDLLVGPNEEGGWLQERFGECVAQISTNSTLKLKSAIKDVFRFEDGYVPSDIEALCKALPTPPQGIEDRDFVFGYKDSDGVWIPGVVETSDLVKDFKAKYPEKWAKVDLLLGLTRQKSRHACGFVISSEPIKNFIPLATIKGVRCTSFSAPEVEAAGGLKMDFLNVNSIKDVENCLRLIQERYWPGNLELEKDEEGIEYTTINGIRVNKVQVVIGRDGKPYDIWDLPEDAAVYRDICEGRVETVFQLEGGAARQGLKEFQPQGDILPLDSVEDLAVFTALDRPGGLDAMVQDEKGQEHNMLVEFARRSKGQNPVGSMPILDELLPETLGVTVYQEQLQHVFQVVADTTAVEADKFRQRIGKKKFVEVDAKDKPVFMKGAVARLGKEEADRLWAMLYAWGQYGFNKSHAVCYMITAYACAWLKHHYPLEWWASVLTNSDRKEIDEEFWQYCGHLIVLPDIKNSRKNYYINGNKIQAPLSLLKGIGDKAHEQLLMAAPYQNIQDLIQKIDAWRVANGTIVEKENKKTKKVEKKLRKAVTALNSTVLKNLIIVGAMDSLFQETDSNGLPLTVLDKLRMYDEAVTAVTGEKPGSSASVYEKDFTDLVKFQFKKKVLPGYSQDMVELVAHHLTWENPHYKAETNVVVRKDEEFRLTSGQDFADLRALDMVPLGGIMIAVPAYVIKWEKLTYVRGGETKTAAKLFLDIDGVRTELVRWPTKNGIPASLEEDVTGAVILCYLSRKEDSDSFFFVDAEIVAPPLKKKETKDEPETSPE